MIEAARFDAVVVGAGPAGAATARWLALAGCRTLLLERGRFAHPRAGESLAPAVKPLLRELGVWGDFEALGAVPSYGTRSLWGSTEPVSHSHLMTPHGTGFHVARQAFDRMLADSAAAAGATLLLDARATRCVPKLSGGFELELAIDAKCGSRRLELAASSVVDAAGRNSPVSRWLGARRALFDRLVGIGATFACDRAPAEGYTLVEAERAGWWYSAPCTRERLVTMLMTDGDLAQAHGARTREGFARALAEAEFTSERLQAQRASTTSAERASMLEEPRVFSAVSQRLVRSERHARWLAVGDAALSVDPISGSGVVRALRSAREASQAILAALAGDTAAIERYERARNVDTTAYLYERAAYYALETRFTDLEFWRRRKLNSAQRNI